MLHRVKKENDCNRDKWIGIGGKFLDGESPEECALREIAARRRDSLVTGYRYRGIVTFVSDRWETEYMHLFTATGVDRPGPGGLRRGRAGVDPSRTGWRPCPSGQGTGSFWTCCGRGRRFSP